MSDTLDLAGVIGTWVAVFLALVALLALLPIYILYKRSRSQVAKALFKVDDPSHRFVSNVFLFGFLLRQTVRVPDLRRPPESSILENKGLENKPTADALGPKKSTTGWVEFAQVITAIFPGVKYGDSSLLDFADERASLPVHNTWLLALGILHRYSMREDYGLPIGAALQAEQDGARDVPLFSGLSGYLSILGPSHRRNGRSQAFVAESSEVWNSVRINFKMHSLASLQKSLRQDSLSFHTLAMLFASLIDGGNDQLFTGIVYSEYQSRDPRFPRVVYLKIMKVTETKFAPGTLTLLPGIVSQATKKFSLVLTDTVVQVSGSSHSHSGNDTELEDTETNDNDPNDSDPNKNGPETFEAKDTEQNGTQQDEIMPNDGLRETIEKLFRPLGLYKVGPWYGAEVWMQSKDAYRFACAYLKQKSSVHGFLYDCRSDFVVWNILSPEDFTSILAMAKTWLAKMDLATEMHKSIDEAIRNVSEAVITWEDSWSRHAMQAISSLDYAIIEVMVLQKAVASQHKIMMWTVIRGIYASHQEFRRDLNKVLKKAADRDQQVPIILFQVEKAEIVLRKEDGAEIGYPFDFRHVFTEAELNQWPSRNKTMPLIDTVLASLQGQLRALA